MEPGAFLWHLDLKIWTWHIADVTSFRFHKVRVEWCWQVLYIYTWKYHDIIRICIYIYTLDYFWYLWHVPIVSCLLLLLYARVISFGRMLAACSCSQLTQCAQIKALQMLTSDKSTHTSKEVGSSVVFFWACRIRKWERLKGINFRISLRLSWSKKAEHINVKEFTEKKLQKTHSVSGCLLSPWMPILRNNWRVWYQSCPLAGPFTAGQQRLLTILGRSREQRRSSDGKGLPCFLMTFVRVCCSSKETNCKTIITDLRTCRILLSSSLWPLDHITHHRSTLWNGYTYKAPGIGIRGGQGFVLPISQPSMKALVWTNVASKGRQQCSALVKLVKIWPGIICYKGIRGDDKCIGIVL